jgi:ABC transporter substrate binding protein
MRRREFITLLGGTAAAWPVAARAQQPDRIRRIGVLLNVPEHDAEAQAWLTGLRQGLEKLGWVQDRNAYMDVRSAAGRADQFPVLAKELVAKQPDVILTHAPPSTSALQRETRTIPIVFVAVSDPIGPGFVASLARPRGNITGLLTFEQGITGKWLGNAQGDRAAPRTGRTCRQSGDDQLRLLPADGRGRCSIAHGQADSLASRDGLPTLWFGLDDRSIAHGIANQATTVMIRARAAITMIAHSVIQIANGTRRFRCMFGQIKRGEVLYHKENLRSPACRSAAECPSRSCGGGRP